MFFEMSKVCDSLQKQRPLIDQIQVRIMDVLTYIHQMKIRFRI